MIHSELLLHLFGGPIPYYVALLEGMVTWAPNRTPWRLVMSKDGDRARYVSQKDGWKMMESWLIRKSESRDSRPVLFW